MFGWLFMLLAIMFFWFMIPDAIGEKKKKLIFLGLSLGVVVFILGSRSIYAANCTDLYNYYRWYVRAIDLPVSELLQYDVMESGYLLLNDIVAWIVPWEYFFFYFQAAFCTGVMFWYIYRNVDNVFLGVLVYICFGPWQFFLTAFRQSFATCICFIAFELIKKRKTKFDLIALGLVALASCIHTTAWLFLAVFIIRYFKVGKGIVIFSAVVAICMTQVIDELVAFSNETLGREYKAGAYYGNILGGLIPILIYIGTLLLCYLAFKNDKQFVEKHRLEINMLIFGATLYLLRYHTHTFERVSGFFTPVISVLLPVAIGNQKKLSERKIITVICVACCCALFFYRAYGQIGTYSFHWDNPVMRVEV